MSNKRWYRTIHFGCNILHCFYCRNIFFLSFPITSLNGVGGKEQLLLLTPIAGVVAVCACVILTRGCKFPVLFQDQRHCLIDYNYKYVMKHYFLFIYRCNKTKKTCKVHEDSPMHFKNFLTGIFKTAHCFFTLLPPESLQWEQN